MSKLGWLIAGMVMWMAGAAQAAPIAWVARPPSAGVKQGEMARVEMVAVNAQDTTQAIDAPVALTGDIGEAGDKIVVQLTRVGEAPKSVPVGGFVDVPYDMVIPKDMSIGEHVLTIRAPLEAKAVLRVLPSTPEAESFTLATRPTTTPVVAPPPLATEPSSRPPITTPGGLVETVRNHLSAYQPMYFIIGNDAPDAKYQVSFRYKLFNEDAGFVIDHSWLNGFYLGYTQMSFWDISKHSAPFFDTSYKPELFWTIENIHPWPKWPGRARFDFQTGIQHESNGKAGADSRSFNIFYVEPIFTVGDKDNLFVTFAPKAYTYVGSTTDNPDIARYRGYFELKFVVGQGDGLQAAILAHIGDDWDKGSIQLDVSYPLHKLIGNTLDVYLHAQLFSGYAESLLNYNQQGTTFRVGLSIVR